MMILPNDVMQSFVHTLHTFIAVVYSSMHIFYRLILLRLTLEQLWNGMKHHDVAIAISRKDSDIFTIRFSLGPTVKKKTL